MQVAVDRYFHGRYRVTASGCWEFTRCRVAEGYGRAHYLGRVQWTHRAAFHIAVGIWPEAVCHGCDNPPCINPEHLRAGTLADNAAEMWAKGRGRPTGKIAPLDLPLVVAALRKNGARRGRTARLDLIGDRFGVSRRTLYRLLSPAETPGIYLRTLSLPTDTEKAA